MAFTAWNEGINLEKARPLLKLLKKHYSIPIYTGSIDSVGSPLPNLYGVTPAREALNTVY